MGKQIKVGAVLSYAQIILNNAISIFYVPFVITYLGKNEYGLFSFVNAIISYISIVDGGFSSAVIRFNSKYIAEHNEEKQKNVNGTFLIIYSILAVLILGIGFLVYANIDIIWGKGFTPVELKLVKKMLIIAIMTLAVSFPLNVFHGIIVANENFVFNKILSIANKIFNTAVSVYILTKGANAYNLVFVSFICTLGVGFINVVYCYKNKILKISLKQFEKNTFKSIVNYSFFTFLSMVAGQLYANTDTLIIGAYLGSGSLAVYNIAVQFNNYYQSFSNFGSGLFLPKLTKLVSTSNQSDIMHLLMKVSRLQTYVCMYIYIAFLCIGKEFIILWVGMDFVESYLYAALLMLPYIISIIQSLFATMLEAMNRHKVKALIYLFVAVFNMVLSLILVKKLGVLGCVLGTCIGMFINAIMNNIYYLKVLKIDMGAFWRRMIGPIILFVGLGVVLYNIFPIIRIKGYFSVLYNALIYTVLFLIYTYIVVFDKTERVLFVGHMKRLYEKLFSTKRS